MVARRRFALAGTDGVPPGDARRAPVAFAEVIKAGSLEAWNDAPDRTRGEVLSVSKTRSSRRKGPRERGGSPLSTAVSRGELADCRINSGSGDLLCECGRQDCTEAITLDLGEFQQVTGQKDVFMVSPGHGVEGIDLLLESRPGYDLVALEGGGG